MSDRAGTHFGQYRLVRLLGRGGMGEVYEAYDTAKDRTVALKLLDASLAHDSGYQTRFRRESHAAARLQEPHVIPIHDWGEIDGRLFIDMRLVVGEDVRVVLRRDGALAPERAVKIVEQVGAALDAAHADGLVHRDVKPENILLDRNDFAYLVDFGIAHSSADVHLTTAGAAIGSYAYMAPERFDEAHGTRAADVYSLGCVLYELLTGEQPFPASTVSAIIKAHLLAAPPQPHSLRPSVPVGFDDVVAIAMAKDPSMRFATAGEVGAAARLALVGGRTRGQVPPGTGVTQVNPRVQHEYDRPDRIAPTAYRISDELPRHRGRGAMPIVLTVLVLAVLALAGVVGWLVVDSRRENRPSDAAQQGLVGTSPAVDASTSAARETTTDEVAPTRISPRSPIRTTAGRSTAARTTRLQPMTGEVTGADDQGFLTPRSARCNADNPAVFVGRTTASLVVVCETGVGRYYYKGVRASDGAGIELDDPVPSENGFIATNLSDGTTYRLSPSSLIITSAGGRTLATETMLEFAYR